MKGAPPCDSLKERFVGYVLSREGERRLEIASGLDPDQIEQEAMIALLRDAQENGGWFTPKIEGMSTSRELDIIWHLEKKGYLECVINSEEMRKEAMSRHSGIRVGDIRITDKGRACFGDGWDGVIPGLDR